jgi:hypothetical protein
VPAVEPPIDNVDAPVPPEERETLEGFRERLSPLGELVADRVTVPAKPLRLVRVIVEAEDDPAFIVSEEGLEVRLKSAELTELTVTETVAWWDSEPLVPVIVTV